jgi:fibronectin type III domain protein
MRSHPVAFVIATSLCLSACSGNSGKMPNAPTTALRVAPASGTSGPNSASGTVSWSCFANGGVTNAAFGATGCPTHVSSVRLASVTAAPLVAPGAPTGFTATASGSVVTLLWTAPAGGDPPTSYAIEAGSATGQANLANFDTGSTATTLAVFNVPSGTYFVRARAVNSAGASAPSNEVQLVVAGGTNPCVVLSPPLGLTGNVIGNNVILEWTPPSSCAPTAYVIQAGSAPGLSNLANFSTGSTAVTFTASNVGPGTYFIRVLSSANGLVSTPSNEVALTVGSCGVVPNAPQNLRATASGSTVTVTWDPPLGGCPPASYLLEAGSVSGATNVAVSSVNGTSLTAANVGNGTYFIRIRAVNAIGQSLPSNEVALTVGASGPTPIVAGFQFFDPATQASATTSCNIVSPFTTTPSVCESRSTSFTTGANAIVLYEWTAQYFYGTPKTLTQSGTNPVFSFGETCGGPGSTDTGAAQALTVTLTVTDNLGNKTTVVSGAGSQPPLQLRLFKC